MPLHRVLLPAVGLAACAAAPLGIAPTPVRLAVDNPLRFVLHLGTIDDDERTFRRLADLGDATAVDVAVLPGACVLRASTGGHSALLPVPLVASALPPDRTLRLSLAALALPLPTDPEFVFVPAGPALCGDELGIGQEDERPARVVDVGAFWLARHETTNRDYAAFLNALGSEPDPGWAAFDSRKFRCMRAADGTWNTDAPDLPVVTVSLAGAEAYCKARTAATGIRHRLPSEVEWEKAARGPSSTVYAYGNVYRRGAANQESGSLRPVGSHPATGFGTCDLTGNAFEWTADRYPAAGTAEPLQVLRGGSFVLDGMYLRNSFRMRQRPDTRTDDFGFRVARDVAPAAAER